jgi:hypothetical protein
VNIPVVVTHEQLRQLAVVLLSRYDIVGKALASLRALKKSAIFCAGHREDL